MQMVTGTIASFSHMKSAAQSGGWAPVRHESSCTFVPGFRQSVTLPVKMRQALFPQTDAETLTSQVMAQTWRFGVGLPWAVVGSKQVPRPVPGQGWFAVAQ